MQRVVQIPSPLRGAFPNSAGRRGILPWLGIIVLCAGCGSREPSHGGPAGALSDAADPPTLVAPAREGAADPGGMTIAQLRERLGIGDAGKIQKVGGQIVAADLRGTGVQDLSVLRGLPLRELYLEQNPVSDISPLSGMPLDKLYLDDTKVSDLAPLTGMTLSELNLSRAPVSDLSPLKDVELGTLWIPETPVSDLSPLAGKSLVSLDIRGTPVSDLSPLAGNSSLRRLQIAETNVADLSPLAGLALERLIFTPARITRGLEAIRGMSSLRALDTRFDGVSPVKSPEEFWRLYDAGEL